MNTKTKFSVFAFHGTGSKFEHTTDAGGIFQIKAVITNGDEWDARCAKRNSMFFGHMGILNYDGGWMNAGKYDVNLKFR